MTIFDQVIAELKQNNPAVAETWQEEIDIVIHKLKFLPKETLPKVVVLEQNIATPVYTNALEEKISTAGGNLISDFTENPDKIIIIQKNNYLYSEITNRLAEQALQETNAFNNNNIYIIQSSNFDNQSSSYLSDIEILAEILQEKYFFYGHEGDAWVKFDV